MEIIGARRGRPQCHAPLWSCNKVLKPNFQSIISRTNYDCSLVSLILAKLLLLNINCENIFALSIVAAIAACYFLVKKCAKMSVFVCENRNNLLAVWGFAPRTSVLPLPPLFQILSTSPVVMGTAIHHTNQRINHVFMNKIC